MKDNRQKPTHPEKTNKAKRPQLQLLNLEQLDSVAGTGPETSPGHNRLFP